MASGSAAATEEPPQAGGGFWAEMATLKTPEAKTVAKGLKPGDQAPSSPKLAIQPGKPAIVVFLRHCGCPFAERNFKALADISQKHSDIQCFAVSHSTQEGTDSWVTQVGGTWNIDVVTDTERDLYAAWGLGLGSWWGTLGPSVLWSVYRLGKEHDLYNRPTEVGTRWQNSGAFAVDKDGIVRWAHPDASPDDWPEYNDALRSIGVSPQ